MPLFEVGEFTFKYSFVVILELLERAEFRVGRVKVTSYVYLL